MEEFSSQDPFAYVVKNLSDNELFVTGVLPGADEFSVVVQLDEFTLQEPDTVYRVIVTGVLDLEFNEIVMESEVSFRSFVITP